MAWQYSKYKKQRYNTCVWGFCDGRWVTHWGSPVWEKRGKKKASLSIMQVTDCLLLAHLQQIQILSILGEKKSFRVSTKAFLASWKRQTFQWGSIFFFQLRCVCIHKISVKELLVSHFPESLFLNIKMSIQMLSNCTGSFFQWFCSAVVLVAVVCWYCPTPPPLWLDGRVKSDSDERCTLHKVEHSSKTQSISVWNRHSEKKQRSHWKQLEKENRLGGHTGLASWYKCVHLNILNWKQHTCYWLFPVVHLLKQQNYSGQSLNSPEPERRHIKLVQWCYIIVLIL